MGKVTQVSGHELLGALGYRLSVHGTSVYQLQQRQLQTRSRLLLLVGR